MKKTIIATFVILTTFTTSCSTQKETKKDTAKYFPEQIIKTETEKQIETETLYKLAEKHGFKFGAVISASSVKRESYTNLIKNDFNSITASNEFKAYSLLDQEGCKNSPNKMPVMNYKNADMIAKFAQENSIGIRGHVLVWDAYMPDYFFKDNYTKEGIIVSSDTMKKRLEYYITEVITHFETNFPGVVYCWDVVNEAVGDSAGDYAAGDDCHIRKVRNGIPNYFYEVIGSDYVELSFKYAREAANKINPDIKLFYNDYNCFYSPKREAIGKLIQKINEKEKLCDGVGMQGYVGGYGQQNGCMNLNDINLFKNAIKFYGSFDLQVNITELAIRNYDLNQANKHADYYEKFFKMLSEINAGKTILTGVSIWGLIDNATMSKSSYEYKMNGPFCGIYNYNLTKKEECKRIEKALQ